MNHYDMSGSEDGQLRSPGDEQYLSGEDDLDEEHDTDSLDIKPPQASIHHSRDNTASSKRREKSNKDKKHSKERRQQQHREERSSGTGTGTVEDRDREREERERERRERAAVVREGRAEIERYQRGSYERNEDGVGAGRDILNANERRYQQKHYERGRDNSHVSHLHHNPQQQPSSQMHMHRRQADFYEHRANDYQHGNDYHAGMRQQYGGIKHGHRVDYGHDINPVAGNMHRDRGERERERRKYNYDGQQDAESLEQDLRSRLLSKRHKYVKDYEPPLRKHHQVMDAEENYEERTERSYEERTERSYEERTERSYEEHKAVKLERHKNRREREKRDANVIEVLDSPEVIQETQQERQSRRHKRREKDRLQELAEKRRSPEDPELLARRAKLLEAEREIMKRKEAAREELEARREKRRERGEIIDELSPTAVAANVTAGLNVVVKRRKNSAEEHVKRKKRIKKSKHQSNEDDENEEGEHSDDDEAGNDEESHSDIGSDAESERHYKKHKSKRKHSKKSIDHDEPNDNDVGEDDAVVKLPDSPLSIGELSKSPEKRDSKKQHRRGAKNVNEDDDDDDYDDDERGYSSRSRSHSRSHSPSESRSRSHSRTSRSRSRSVSHSAHSHSDSRSRSNRSISRSGSEDSRSQTSRSRSHSRSAHRSSSHTRSRSRSEERDMKANLRKSAGEERLPPDDKKSKHHMRGEGNEVLPPCDDKGVPLPNYFPGIQGCRSVEEFQCLNRIEEGTYGVVYRAKDKRTNEIVALKRLKMEKEKEGFPITSLREINTLLKGQHPNIVTVREIVVGSNMDKIFIVMDYVEHDLKSLMETMKTRKQSFLPGEVKCLTQQLLRAVGHLHDNWILHRDLKTSNLLLSHKGILKVGDFGLAREYGSPLKKYTSLVVTLWYRAPELLLCSPEYSTPIDIWSVGCIFAEFLQMAPLFPGKSEIDELNRIFKELGTPNEKIWPGYKELPAVKNLLSQNSQFAEYPVSNLRKRFHEKSTDTGIALLQGLLTYDPKQRLNADAALKHAYFKELPLPIDPSMFPTWPAKSELGARKALASSPKPPSGGSQFKQLGRDEIISNSAAAGTNKASGFSGIITGNKKTASNTGFVLNAGIEQRQVAMGPGFNLKF